MFISPENIKLKRELGFLSLVLIGMGGTLGGGIFVLLSEGVSLAGVWLPFSFILGSIFAFAIALLYGEVASSVPTAGANLEFLFTSYDKKMVPFIIGWLTILGDLAFAGLNLLGFSYHLGLLIPVSPFVISVLALLLVTFFNLKGTRVIGGFQTVIAFLLVLLLGGFLFFAERKIDWQTFEATFQAGRSFSITGILAGAALVFTAFIGYEDLAAMAGETKNPGKVMPKALLTTVAVSSIIFLLVCAFSLLLVSPDKLAQTDTPLLLVSEKLGKAPTLMIEAAAILATFTSFSVTLFMASRKLYTLSKYNFFKDFFTVLNENKIPVNSVVLCSIVTFLLIVANSVSFVAYLGNTSYLITLIALCIGVFLLRRKRPHLKRPFKVPFFPFLPAFIILCCVTLIFFMSSFSLIVTLLWALIGFLFYLFSFLDKKRIPWIFYGILLFLLINGGLFLYFFNFFSG